MSHITVETNIISILEIQGIKFTSRNFQIEIELKQVMVLNNEPIFNSCLIKTTKPKVSTENIFENKSLERKIPDSDNNLGLQTGLIINDLEEGLEESLEEGLDNSLEDSLDNVFKNDLVDNVFKNDLVDNIILSIEDDVNEIKKTSKPLDNGFDFELDIEDLDEQNNDDTDELKEVTINTDLDNNTLESIQLKKPNQVYFELYVEARNKAKLAKRNAILAYLEVKSIKKTYMIDNTVDSDSDFDAEIDEVSESELE